MKGKNLALTVAFFCIAALVACANSSKSQGDADVDFDGHTDVQAIISSLKVK